MANKDVLNNLLQPVNPADNARWQEFLETVREDVLWNPDSDGLFQSLDFKFSGVNEGPSEPSAHIHTANIPNRNVFILLEGNELVILPNFRIFPIKVIELKPRGWD